MNHAKESSDYFLKFDRILAIENFKKHLILALINFYISIFAIYRQQKKGWHCNGAGSLLPEKWNHQMTSRPAQFSFYWRNFNFLQKEKFKKFKNKKMK
jgi:hypothetical protein